MAVTQSIKTFYDSNGSTGRFLTRDRARVDANWWAYCDSQPVRDVDPLGLQRMTLPEELGGLPPRWFNIRHGGDTGDQYERWLKPDGQEGLEYHWGRQGEPGHRSKATGTSFGGTRAITS
jgi:hypothetical protein